jgi:hypothetical protein
MDEHFGDTGRHSKEVIQFGRSDVFDETVRIAREANNLQSGLRHQAN